MTSRKPILNSVNRNQVEYWKLYELTILNEIERTGQKRGHQYKYSCPRRTCKNSCLCVCSATLCLPLFLWDVTCCTCQQCCGTSCKYGLWFKYTLDDAIDTNADMQTELRTTIAEAVNIKMYESDVFEVIHAYIRRYNLYKHSNPNLADIIRDELKTWIASMYMVYPRLLKIYQHTNMDEIIEIVNEYSRQRPPYQYMNF